MWHEKKQRTFYPDADIQALIDKQPRGLSVSALINRLLRAYFKGELKGIVE